MKPDREGIWEWFEEDGTKRLVAVFNIEPDASRSPYFRVYWWGGYYNVNDEHDPEAPEYDHLTKAEWPDRWGNYVGRDRDIPQDQLYLGPTPEQREKILKKV